MSDIQRIIKYFAIAFAMLLIVSIFSGIMKGVLSIDSIFNDSDPITEKLEGLETKGDVSILEINVRSVNINIKHGDILKAESNSKYVKIKQDNNKLHITEKKHNNLNYKHEELTIYIPSDMVFDGVLINTGAGKIDIDKLVAKRLCFELGAGSVNINNLIAYGEAIIKGGAGEVIISNGSLQNLDLKMGIGRLLLTSIVKGDSEIEAGIGEIDLHLIGPMDNYKIKVDKGIGSTSINGESIINDTYYGTGNSIIDIEGGIGKIDVNFISD